jgi:hypothetical protein
MPCVIPIIQPPNSTTAPRMETRVKTASTASLLFPTVLHSECGIQQAHTPSVILLLYVHFPSTFRKMLSWLRITPTKSMVQRLISGFCISSHPPQQGSGYYRSSSDNYNLELTANTPFITCSSDTITSGDTPSYTSTLLEAVCGVDACQYPEDTPECDRIARFDATFYVQLKAQNYGSGGTPHCSAAAVSPPPSLHLDSRAELRS